MPYGWNRADSPQASGRIMRRPDAAAGINYAAGYLFRISTTFALAISIRFRIGLLVSSCRSTRLGLVAHDATVALPAPTGHPTGFVESRPTVSEKKPRAGLPKTHGASAAWLQGPVRRSPPVAATARGRVGDAIGEGTMAKTMEFIRRAGARRAKR